MAIVLLCLSAMVAALDWGMAQRLAPEQRRAQERRWLRGWAIKGLLVPLAIWALMNFGLSWSLPAFMPLVQAAQNRGSGWGAEFLRTIASGGWIVCTYWGAVTLGWAVARAGAEA